MLGDLYINSQDAWATWKVAMGNGFIENLLVPAGLKEFIENESRLEHGKRMITANAKVDSREITLGFTIMGTNESDYRTKRKAFLSELQAGAFTVKVPILGADVYKLVYTGRSISYGLSADRTFGHFTMKATEPNPADRTEG